MKRAVVPIAYENDGCGTLTLKNAQELEDMLSDGWSVIRVDALPGLCGKGKYGDGDSNACFDPSLPPTLVYIIAKDATSRRTRHRTPISPKTSHG